MPVKVTIDKTADFAKAMRELVKGQALVGIPAANAARENEDGTPSQLNNAEIGYIQEFGAPEANIPPRPFLEPGIADAKDKIAKVYAEAARALLSGDISTMEKAHAKAGAVAAAAVVEKFSDGSLAPLAESTIYNRQHRTSGRRTGDEQPLVDSGQLRRAITYVVRPAKNKNG